MKSIENKIQQKIWRMRKRVNLLLKRHKECLFREQNFEMLCGSSNFTENY